MNLARKMRDDFDAVLSEYDVIVMPTVTVPARRHIPTGSSLMRFIEAFCGYLGSR